MIRKWSPNILLGWKIIKNDIKTLATGVILKHRFKSTRYLALPSLTLGLKGKV